MSETQETIVSETIDGDGADVSVNLTLNDIQNAVKVIDFAAEQGAFKGWGTIEQVLIVRNRLTAFVAAAGGSVDDASDTTETATDSVES